MDNNIEIDMNVNIHKFCVSVVSCLVAEFRLNKVVQTWNSSSISGIHLLDQEKNVVPYMEIKIWKSNLNLKFEIWFKQKSKFKFYVLFFEKLKIDEKGDEKGFLRVLWVIRGVLQCREDFVKKITEVHFSIFIENRNWDLKFVFRFDDENKKRKKKNSISF